MKTTRLITALALFSIAAFTSCKKSYTCTCTTVVGTGSVKITHSIDNVYPMDAKRTCNNYQDQANNTLPGGTTCSL